MSDNFYPPLEVYKNLRKIFTYRSLELANGNYTARAKTSQPWLTDDKFMELIQWERFCTVEAKDLQNKDRRHPKCNAGNTTYKTKTFFIILDKDYDTNSTDIAKMMNRLPSIDANERKFNIEIILISEDYLTIHSKKKLEQYESCGTETAGYVNITNQLHTLFMHDLFAREGMPKFRIIPRPEEESIMSSCLINKINIEKKSSKDPVMIVLGAVPGDLIEIIAFNENTAQQIRYGVVR
jgi:DNA-directed RNA polymerase subunit H (RpoH/RPB5)